jgi:predicted DCC family thiol-disulfide oxidoreductase YuxK
MASVPKLVYDDDCHFCTWSATFAVRRADIQPVKLSKVQAGDSRLSEFEREHLPDGYEECAQLITENAVYSCGAATEESLVLAGVLPRRPVEFLRRFETYGWLRETFYHALSNNRDIVANVLGREPPVSAHVPEDDVYPERRSGSHGEPSTSESANET